MKSETYVRNVIYARSARNPIRNTVIYQKSKQKPNRGKNFVYSTERLDSGLLKCKLTLESALILFVLIPRDSY